MGRTDEMWVDGGGEEQRIYNVFDRIVNEWVFCELFAPIPCVAILHLTGTWSRGELLN